MRVLKGTKSTCAEPGASGEPGVNSAWRSFLLSRASAILEDSFESMGFGCFNGGSLKAVDK